MSRPRGWLLFAALFALAVAAVVDAFRGGAGDTPPRASDGPAVATKAYAAADDLRERGIDGLLYATERRGRHCRLLVFRLPAFERLAAVETSLCRVEAAPGGRIALWSSCPVGEIEVRRFSGQLVERPVTGCAPAWTPEGRLTFVSGGSVVALEPSCPVPGQPCFRPVLSARTIRRELHSAALLPRSGTYSVREIGWQSSTRLVALVRWRGPFVADFIAVFEAGKLLPRTEMGPPGRLSHLYVNRRGHEVLARADPQNAGYSGFFVWGRNGVFVGHRTHVFLADRAYARSLDGRWVATASRDSISIFPASERGRPSDYVSLHVAAADIAWG